MSRKLEEFLYFAKNDQIYVKIGTYWHMKYYLQIDVGDFYFFIFLLFLEVRSLNFWLCAQKFETFWQDVSKKKLKTQNLKNPLLYMSDGLGWIPSFLAPLVTTLDLFLIGSPLADKFKTANIINESFPGYSIVSNGNAWKNDAIK